MQPPVKLQHVFKNLSLDVIVYMTQAPDDDRYWYVVEKSGRVLRIENNPDATDAKVFIDISDRVDAGPSEAGLLGMAFHPQFRTNGYVYLSYTGNEAGLKSYISRFKSLDSNESLDTATEKRLLEVAQPYSNHNGGQIEFGPDGFLYIGLGDGGAGGDPKGNGQNVNTLLGSLLRIDVDHGDPYAIPAENPFAKNKKGRPEIYAWGLRNPWRWTFDRETGRLWVADVGQDSWEEVNIIDKPGNYGWNSKEGSHCYKSAHCDNPNFIDPVIEYNHDEGCSITGGYVYRGKQIPGLNGIYLYSDFCSGKLWGARQTGSGVYQSFQLLDTNLNVASFAQSNDGEIYLVHLRGGIYKLVNK
jgi:glucose/arabinose dehydrogenase